MFRRRWTSQRCWSVLQCGLCKFVLFSSSHFSRSIWNLIHSQFYAHRQQSLYYHTWLRQDTQVPVLIVVPQLVHVQHWVLLVGDVIPVGHDGGSGQHHASPLIFLTVLLLEQMLHRPTHQLLSPRRHLDLIVHWRKEKMLWWGQVRYRFEMTK